MMIYTDIDFPNKLWIRDFKYEKSRRKNRAIGLDLDIKKAESMAGTIRANAQALESLILLLMFDIEFRIKSGKIRMWNKNKIKWTKELAMK